MKKNEINRTDLKKDFLKQTIVRIDYDYLFDEYVESTMKNVDKYLTGKGYSIKNSFLSQVDFNVDFDKLTEDMSVNVLDTINVASDKREKYFSFINEEKHIKIDITREYSAISVDYVEHIHFDEICEIFKKIVEELYRAREGLQIKRVGLRKVNVFFLNSLENIEQYFETNVFNFSSSNLDTYEFIGKNSYDNYKYKGYIVNQIANIAQGYLQTDDESKLMYQLALDFDIYEENPLGDLHLDDMNEYLFEIYKNSLTENFLNELTSEEFDSEEIFKI